jgi:hypothetical protein
MITTKGKETEIEAHGQLLEKETYFVHTGLPRKADGSKLKLWKEINGRTMTKENWEVVVQAFKARRQAPVFDGFKSKEGKEFSCPVEIWMTAGGIRAGLPPRSDGTALNVFCPVTKEPLLMRIASNNAPYYVAKGFPGLVMFSNIHGRDIPPEEWEEILKAGQVKKPGPEMTFNDKEGNPYQKTFQVRENEQGKFEIEEKYIIKKTATQTMCPVSGEPIMESKNCYYSAAFPEVQFPKKFWWREFTPQDVCEIVQAAARKTEPPRFTLFRQNGDSYDATLSIGEDGSIVATPCQNETMAKTESAEIQTPARGLSR